MFCAASDINVLGMCVSSDDKPGQGKWKLTSTYFSSQGVGCDSA